MSPYKIPACAGKPYRPSNGTEGMMFTDRFCEVCKKEARYRATCESAKPEGGCEILLATLMLDVDEPGYPPEWTHTDRGEPTCTAFEATP